ncbi:type II toxin-antitoxin system VapC family toxin [Leptolyngbya sp. AN03gr2]|uniref:type II toxin-antitoxin system VapC family toxin n=1 Tax=unclassified Leptolyngbya TaxID=2650499 RepID=UPI003D31A31D
MQTSNGKPLVFLDTNVVVSYLRGESPSSRLFSHDIIDKVHLAINPVVLQELFLLSETRDRPEALDEIQQEVTLLPLNLEKAEEYLKQAADLRNRIAHSNDVLILSSASDCDYLVTYDQALKKTLASLSTGKPEVVTPEQLISQLTAKV